MVLVERLVTMSAMAPEVCIYTCTEHVDIDLELTHPDYKFNWYSNYTSKKCVFDGCLKKAFNVYIGVQIPEVASVGSLEPSNIAITEIFNEARQITKDGDAVDKLTSYLYFKTRMFSYSSGDLVSLILLKKYAKLLLRELSISEDSELSDDDLKKLLNYLGITPYGYKL